MPLFTPFIPLFISPHLPIYEHFYQGYCTTNVTIRSHFTVIFKCQFFLSKQNTKVISNQYETTGNSVICLHLKDS